jgi:tripartite-type tricarboxylate transporter receptor subunit TctC
MTTIPALFRTIFFSATLLIAGAVCAESAYPSKPLTLVVPTAAGGPTDFVARQLAQQLGQALGQSVVVRNVAGASGTVGTAEVARAKPDGYTLLFALNTAITLAPNIQKNLPYDVKRDLAPIVQVARTPLVLYTNVALPVADFSQFVDLAKKQKGQLSFGFPGAGSAFHLLGEYVSKQQGLALIPTPYKGAAPMLNDLIGGQIAAGINDIGLTSQFVKAGKLRALAATGAVRSSAAPDIPTFTELGIPDTDQFSPWWGVFAPAGTPPQVVSRVEGEIVRILTAPQMKSKLLESGYEVTALPSAEMGRLINSELARWAKVLDALGNPKFD